MKNTEEAAMTKKFQVYKCEIFGNIAEVLHVGAG